MHPREIALVITSQARLPIYLNSLPLALALVILVAVPICLQMVKSRVTAATAQVLSALVLKQVVAHPIGF